MTSFQKQPLCSKPCLSKSRSLILSSYKWLQTGVLNEDQTSKLKLSCSIDTLIYERNMRALYIYHQERLNWLEKQVWLNGNLPDQIDANLHSAESEYFKAYKNILAKYS